MLDSVRSTISQHDLAAPGEPLWVAVSGGVDSMVLLHVLRKLGHPCKVAHVDHGLRAGSSDADRAFVEGYCSDQEIPCVARRVEVKERAAATGESTQMAARHLRSVWLSECAAEGPLKVATAHHADDVVETFIMGLIQGMGAHGWGSIPVRSGPFIRPLLRVRREEILAYARREGVPWREDASNQDSAYLRNRVRHELLPMLDEWRPGTRRNLERNVMLFGELDLLARNAMASALAGLVPEPDGTLRVPFDRVLGNAPHLVLYELLRTAGFHPDQFESILRAIRAHRSGAEFHGKGVRVLVDRDQLVISRRQEAPPTWSIPGPGQVPDGTPLQITSCSAAAIDTTAGRSVAWLDADKVVFPWILRPWKAGDRMQPAGLRGSKLVSDVLIDAKVPKDLKERTYVLIQGTNILWLCGHRLASGCNASPTSRRVLRLDWSGR